MGDDEITAQLEAIDALKFSVGSAYLRVQRLRKELDKSNELWYDTRMREAKELLLSGALRMVEEKKITKSSLSTFVTKQDVISFVALHSREELLDRQRKLWDLEEDEKLLAMLREDLHSRGINLHGIIKMRLERDPFRIRNSA